MLARLFLALILAALSLPQAAMACHQPRVEPAAATAAAHAMPMADDCHRTARTPAPDQPQPDRAPDLCMGCVAPATIRPVILAQPLPLRALPARPIARDGRHLPIASPATPPPRPTV
ncbi:hypothetical protein NYR55_04940 [Sphingomonas sp. BGYR3]|uniref:hypothetical protein n=1 Tax=Sphingomonas sp. BGYR3 TaxID=2975483 RepID=UPI0021A85AE9|nr:hypothetical protein [Sphingomonas sp. BGYR3]MDG5487965.1 hypothetical protein [Sphingomonas sp. BGYR3]